MQRTPPPKDDWSRRRFYRTMLYIFRQRSGDKPVEPPFYEKRPLTAKEFQEAQAQYVRHAFSEELTKAPGITPPPMEELRLLPPGIYPDPGHSVEAGVLLHRIHRLAGFDLPVGHPTRGAAQERAARWDQASAQDRKRWELFQLAGVVYFADTAEKQSRARKELRARLSGRPTPLTQLCRDLLKVLPQAKAKIGWKEKFLTRHTKDTSRPDVLGLVYYRAERQFVWNFLRKEVRAFEETKSLKLVPPKRLRVLAYDLCEAYPYLRLTVEEIHRGLTNLRQADEETAKRFKLRSPGVVRSILSQSRQRHRRTRQ